ncbi:uncharacterized protein LOC126366558 isoform X2 [Pectinophora gossypiella]|nr:uncharacterized protein LOC126366558 isoform X2 [Pectinophora gossypiella]
MICMELLFVLTTCVWAQAMPMGCSEDAHCPSGFYCEASELFCRECLRCQDLKRQSPPTLTTCITSVTQCGPCFSELIEDIDNHCVSPESGKQLLPYEWAVIAVSLVLAVLVCAAAAYILRNFHTFKIRASTRTSVHSPEESIVAASAPHPPPPYNVVAALPPASQCEESLPFIKPVSSPHRSEARESAGSQSARVFNNPSYVRTLQPSYEIPTEHDEILPTIQENISDNEHNIRTPTITETVTSATARPSPPSLTAGPRSSSTSLKTSTRCNSETN